MARDKAALLQVLYGFNRCQKSSTRGTRYPVPENNLPGTSYGIIDMPTLSPNAPCVTIEPTYSDNNRVRETRLVAVPNTLGHDNSLYKPKRGKLLGTKCIGAMPSERHVTFCLRLATLYEHITLKRPLFLSPLLGAFIQ